MLGYDTFANKLAALVISGTICAAAGAAYALLFGYVGSTFASIQYSILPLLWVLLGGAATTLGPLSARCSCTIVDRHHLAAITSAYLLSSASPSSCWCCSSRRASSAPSRERWLDGCHDAAARPRKGSSRHFGGLKAVDDVDFALLPGEIRAIIGPNGAGKTTFVSLICGRIEPSSGHDRLRRRRHHRPAGAPARAARHRLHVPDHQRLRQPDRLRQCRACRAAHADDDGRRRGARASSAAIATRSSASGWPTAHEQLAGTLAYGHQRLLEVAMGLALKPRLLILDEPTQGLSDAEIEGFIALVREIAQRSDRAADRAQHGRGHAARRPHHRARTPAASWPKARPRRSAPTPRCSTPISGPAADG